jgi:hypothetical protein
VRQQARGVVRPRAERRVVVDQPALARAHPLVLAVHLVDLGLQRGGRVRVDHAVSHLVDRFLRVRPQIVGQQILGGPAEHPLLEELLDVLVGRVEREVRPAIPQPGDRSRR